MFTLRPQSDLKGVRSGEQGQAAVALVVILGLFLLGALGLAVDLTNVWFHRQNAQAAADAACQAGAIDLLEGATPVGGNKSGFTAGNASDCTTTPGSSICAYAVANGYNGAGLTSGVPSNNVSWSFPSSVTGVTAVGSNPYLKVNISENIRTYLMGMVNAARFITLNVNCTCGVVQVKGITPMLVLSQSASGALNMGGKGIRIVGGPKRGLQVNSNSPTAVIGSSLIDLSGGGFNQTGSDAAVTGGPSSPNGGTFSSSTCTSTSGYCSGTTGVWRSNVLPLPDPFGFVNAPTAPTNQPSPTSVAYHVDGCPDTSGCREYAPGLYSSGIALASSTTAIFLPGIYYMEGDLKAVGTSTIRNAYPTGSVPTDGVTFYFEGGSMNFAGSTGTNTSLDPVRSTAVTCDGSLPQASLNIPANLAGSMLMAECTQGGTYWDTAGDTADSRGAPGVRGILVFQAHDNTAGPSFSGSGELSFGGALYFHSRVSGVDDVLSFQGNSSSVTFVIGEIVSDQISFGGNGSVSLALDPTATLNTSKVAILQ